MNRESTSFEFSSLSQFLLEEMLFFGLLGKILYLAPEKELFQMLVSENLFDDVPFSSQQERFQIGLSLLKEWVQASGPKLSDETLLELQVDYTRLFVGERYVPAPLWESVYFNKERQVFQRETSQVREWYQKYNLQVDELNHEPDDHLGLELSFLSHMAKVSLEAQVQNDCEKLGQLLDDQLTFMSEHPLLWVHTWCSLVEQNALTTFYRGLACLIDGAMINAAEVIEKHKKIE